MDKGKFKGLARIVFGLALVFTMSAAHAVGVTVDDVFSGDGEANFGTTFTQSGAFDEIIEIDLNAFVATSSSFGDLNIVTDSVRMNLTAPTGYKITSITYTEEGSGNTGNGIAAASGTIFINSTPNNFAMVLLQQNSNSGWTIGPVLNAVDGLDSVEVEITNMITAIALDASTTTTIGKSFAEIEVGLTAVPIPPAIWMMGAAITALVTVGRRGGQAS